MVGWCNDDGSVFLPESFSHDTAPVVAVTDKHSSAVIDQSLHHLVVMLVGWGKYQGREPVGMVNGSMKLEAIVLTLPVLAELGHACSYLVSVSPYGLTDREHGTVSKAQGRITRKE